jgi:hypothetical protein
MRVIRIAMYRQVASRLNLVALSAVVLCLAWAAATKLLAALSSR